MSEVTLFNVVALYQGNSVLAEEQGSCYQTTCERESVLLEGYLNSLASMEVEENLAQPQQRITAMISALERTPDLKTRFESSYDGSLSELKQQASSLSINDGEASPLSKGSELEGRLRQAVATCHKELADQEIQITGQAMKDAFTTLGYEVEQKGPATRATRKGTTIWAEMGAKGEVTVDVSGLTGLSCISKVQELGEELRRRGITLEHKATTRHNNVKGGRLAKALRAQMPEPPIESNTLDLPIIKRLKVKRRSKISG